MKIERSEGGRKKEGKEGRGEVSHAREPPRLVPPVLFADKEKERTDLMFETVEGSVAERALVRSRDLALIHAQSSLRD